MNSSVWHQVLALDAQYNTCRFPNKREPHYRTLYLRRRSQLLREYGLEYSSHSQKLEPDSFDSENSNDQPNPREEYLKLRALLLAARYGPISTYPGPSDPLSRRSRSRTSSVRSFMMQQNDFIDENGTYNSAHSNNSLRHYNSHQPNYQVAGDSNRGPVPTRRADASRALAGNTSVSESYAFSGIKHIFDHHCPAAITRICFPNNDASRLAVGCLDGSVSICRTWPSQQEAVLTVMKGHRGCIMDLTWSMANDFLISVSRDGSACLWNVEQAYCTRSYESREIGAGQLIVCELQPMNNNLLVVGGENRSMNLQTINLSTGKSTGKTGRDKLPGRVSALTFDMSNGETLWVGTSTGLIQSYKCEPTTGKLTRARRLTVSNSSNPGSVTSLSFRAWIDREARDPCVLCNLGSTNQNSPDSLLFLRVINKEGQLALKKRYNMRTSHGHLPIRSCFFPLISFRQGACVATGSADTSVHMYDVGHSGCGLITRLQGHAAPVLDVAVSCDERVMASCDESGVVILWKRCKDDAESETAGN